MTACAQGIVIKPLDGPYRPGQSGWHKLRARTTTEAIVAGVTGSAREPRTLLLARLDRTGHLRYVGRTAPLAAPSRREIALLLQPATDHPWPVPLPVAWQGRLGRPEPLPYVPLVPSLVAEFGADVAFETGRFRHPVRYLRPRLDLDPADIPPWTYARRPAGSGTAAATE